jgi:hypothetical protein
MGCGIDVADVAGAGTGAGVVVTGCGSIVQPFADVAGAGAGFGVVAGSGSIAQPPLAGALTGSGPGGGSIVQPSKGGGGIYARP